MATQARVPVKLISGNAHPALAAVVARELQVPLEVAEVAAFVVEFTTCRSPGEVLAT